MPATPETILAFDFGLRRIGVAVGQQVTASANPLAVIHNSENGPDWTAIGELILEWQPARIIVGMPACADGSPSEISNCVNGFIRELARFDRPIETQAEKDMQPWARSGPYSSRTLRAYGENVARHMPKGVPDIFKSP
ncbi:MAG: Holliday junction resolvase RuvX, partial [Proteobacteria bacterium]|nr:Holliday junction resolvase RuvX [Pseudomonadota bacterium]